MQNWPHHLPWFSSTGLPSFLDISISIHGSIILPRKRAQQLVPPSLHFHLLHLHIPSTSLWVGCTISVLTLLLSSQICCVPFTSSPSPSPSLYPPGFQWFAPEASSESCPDTIENLISKAYECLASWSGLYQRSDYAGAWSPVPWPSNQTHS